MTLQIAQLGAARIDPATNVPMATVALPLGDGETSPYGSVPMVQCLGVTSLPAPATEGGAAEGLLAEGIGGLNGAVLGARDTRCADVVGTMSPGDTTLHSTGEDKATRAQVACKANLLAALVGNDQAVVMDRENDRFQLAFGGAMVQIEEGKISIVAKGGKAGILIDGETGSLSLFGAQVILGGLGTPPVAGVSSVLYGPTGLAAVPAVGVHIVPG